MTIVTSGQGRVSLLLAEGLVAAALVAAFWVMACWWNAVAA